MPERRLRLRDAATTGCRIENDRFPALFPASRRPQIPIIHALR
jgi:hypothetical protein